MRHIKRDVLVVGGLVAFLVGAATSNQTLALFGTLLIIWGFLAYA